MPRAPRCLLGPRHVHPGVNTEADYRRRHLEAILKGRKKYPNLDWQNPWPTVARPPVYVSGGMVQIRCATPGCGNCPAVSPEWRLALCWDCGAIYEGLELPEDFDAIARLLVARPELSTRNWLPGETVEDLERENVEHGIGVDDVTAGLPVMDGVA